MGQRLALATYVVERRAELSGASLLDLGCGMGLSGTAAAAAGGRVLFADLEPPALLFARLNSLPYGRRVRTRRVDWRTDRLGERFDRILGADILYERKQWDFLEPFWRAHLAPHGSVLLGEPGRKTGEMFVEWIAERGVGAERVSRNRWRRGRDRCEYLSWSLPNAMNARNPAAPPSTKNKDASLAGRVCSFSRTDNPLRRVERFSQTHCKKRGR